MATPRLSIPEIVGGQANAYITHNEGLAVLDAHVQAVIQDLDLSTPPGSPSEGDLYYVAGTGTGDWAGHDGELAFYIDSAWEFHSVFTGFQAWVADENTFEFWTGSAWQVVSDPTPEKKHVFSPEFRGAVTGSFSGSGTNTGTLATTHIVSGNDRRNIYEWDSGEATLQDYDVVVRVRIPDEFSAWGTTAITLNFVTETAVATDNAVSLYVYRDGQTDSVSDTDNAASSGGTWDTITVAGSSLSAWLAGEDMVIQLRLFSKNNNYARIGDIEIDWILTN